MILTTIPSVPIPARFNLDLSEAELRTMKIALDRSSVPFPSGDSQITDAATNMWCDINRVWKG